LRPHGTGQRHGQHLGEAGRQADRHPAGQGAAQPPKLLARARDLVQDAPSVFEQHLACLGRHHAASGAPEQALPQLDLELAHLPAQRGLRDVERDGSPRETAQFGHAHEIFELLGIHGERAGLEGR